MDLVMIVGYARVSTDEQKLDLQIQALESLGCNIIFKDHGKSGRSFDRIGLDAALERLKPGSTLVVWRLDRLGRSLTGLVTLIESLGKRQVHFRSVMENIDTNTSGGRLMFHMMAALAEFERSLISERTRAGIDAARANGKHVGRPQALTAEQKDEAYYALRYQGMSMPEIADTMRVSTRTVQRALRHHVNKV
jgi:DNA invertase Pin-like site-specific DNA recombinase